MESLQGHFLVASPHLGDPNFYRSVVLLLKHDAQGALGLVLNRPTNNSLASVWKLLGETDCTNQEPIYLGGPVAGPLMALHCYVSLSQGEVLPGLYFTSSRDGVHRLVTKPKTKRPFRVFTGYSGWSGGQLESEMSAGGWLTVPATKELAFLDSESVWKHLVQQIGFEILRPTLTECPLPDDPSWN